MPHEQIPIENPPLQSRWGIVEYRFGNKDHTNAATYDSTRYIGAANEYRQTVMASAYRKLMGPLEGKRILDVGCGTGRGVIDFGREAKFAIGIDASVDMLTVAASKRDQKSRCALLTSYAQRLPFKDGTFDVVTSLNFLHLFNLETQRVYVAEMKRVLKPSGILVLEFTNALNGLVVGLFRRWVRGELSALPGEIRQVIGRDCQMVRVYGALFPTLWRLLYRLPRPVMSVEKLGYILPFNHVCHRVYYKVAKCDGRA